MAPKKKTPNPLEKLIAKKQRSVNSLKKEIAASMQETDSILFLLEDTLEKKRESLTQPLDEIGQEVESMLNDIISEANSDKNLGNLKQQAKRVKALKETFSQIKSNVPKEQQKYLKQQIDLTSENLNKAQSSKSGLGKTAGGFLKGHGLDISSVLVAGARGDPLGVFMMQMMGSGIEKIAAHRRQQQERLVSDKRKLYASLKNTQISLPEDPMMQAGPLGDSASNPFEAPKQSKMRSNKPTLSHNVESKLEEDVSDIKKLLMKIVDIELREEELSKRSLDFQKDKAQDDAESSAESGRMSKKGLFATLAGKGSKEGAEGGSQGMLGSIAGALDTAVDVGIIGRLLGIKKIPGLGLLAKGGKLLTRIPGVGVIARLIPSIAGMFGAGAIAGGGSAAIGAGAIGAEGAAIGVAAGGTLAGAGAAAAAAAPIIATGAVLAAGAYSWFKDIEFYGGWFVDSVKDLGNGIVDKGGDLIHGIKKITTGLSVEETKRDKQRELVTKTGEISTKREEMAALMKSTENWFGPSKDNPLFQAQLNAKQMEIAKLEKEVLENIRDQYKDKDTEQQVILYNKLTKERYGEKGSTANDLGIISTAAKDQEIYDIKVARTRARLASAGQSPEQIESVISKISKPGEKGFNAPDKVLSKVGAARVRRDAQTSTASKTMLALDTTSQGTSGTTQQGSSGYWKKDGAGVGMTAGGESVVGKTIFDMPLEDVLNVSVRDSASSSDIDHQELIKKALMENGITDPRAQANILAQAQAESNFKPRSEDPSKYASSKSEYKGRGYIQLTGKANYENMTKKLQALGYTNIDLVKNPEQANEPEVAAQIAALYYKDRAGGNIEKLNDINTVNKYTGFHSGTNSGLAAGQGGANDALRAKFAKAQLNKLDQPQVQVAKTDAPVQLAALSQESMALNAQASKGSTNIINTGGGSSQANRPEYDSSKSAGPVAVRHSDPTLHALQMKTMKTATT